MDAFFNDVKSVIKSPPNEKQFNPVGYHLQTLLITFFPIDMNKPEYF
jgi:hypothetical protein